jgi:phage protein U
MSGIYTMMTLGGFKFGVSTAAYQELKRTTEYLWPSQQRFGAAPALQSTGLGDDAISLSGVVYPEWNGGTGQLDDLRSLAADRQPLTMIDGRGNVLGRWVIERVEEGQSVFAQAGVARKQEFTLGLKKYDDIQPDAGLVASLSSALPIPAGITALPQISASLSATSSAADMVASVSATANAALSSASRISGQVGAALSNVSRIANTLGVHAPGIVTALTRSLSSVNSIRTAAGDGLDLLRKVQTVSSAASAVRGVYDNVSAQVQPATASSASIKASLASLQGAGAASDTLATVTAALVSANRTTALVSSLRDNANTIMKRIGA